jgi:PQQ-like domain
VNRSILEETDVRTSRAWLTWSPIQFIGLLLFLFPRCAVANTLFFPQVVAGDGFSTTFTLVNSDSVPLTGQLLVLNQNGTYRATPSGWDHISISAGGSARFTLSNAGPLTVGSAYFQTTASANALATFERRNQGRIESIATVLGVGAGSRFLVPVDISSSSSTGVAFVNATGSPTNIRLELVSESGFTIALKTDARFTPLPARSQIAQFVAELFPQLELKDFKGSLIVESTDPEGQIAATGLIVSDSLLAGLPAIASFSTPNRGILIGLLGGNFSASFEHTILESSGTYSFALTPGVYEMSGEVSNTLVIGLGGVGLAGGLVGRIVAGSIGNVEGPITRVSDCYIAYTSLSGRQPFRFQFVVSADGMNVCDKGVINTILQLTQNPAETHDVRAVTLSDQAAVVASTSRQPNREQNLSVRSYDLVAGKLVWIDETPSVPGLNASIFAVAERDRVFVAGYVPSSVCCSSMFVRAYNASTGQVLWTDVFKKGRDDLPQNLAASPAAVIVVGYGANTVTPPISALDFLVRAYQPITGAVLWEDRVDNGFLVDDAAWAVTMNASQAFVVGTSSAPAGTTNLLVRAYDVFTGKLIWQTSRAGMPAPTGVSIVGNTLTISGRGYSILLDDTTGEGTD